MSAKVTRQGVRVLMLTLAATLAAATANPADATGPRGHGREAGWHHGNGSDATRRLARLTPGVIPIMDGDFNGATMRTQPALGRISAILANAYSVGTGV